MTYNKRRIGSKYEHAAGAFLEKKGFQILEYNYRCRSGEIDLIAKDGEYYVFIEVKYRSSDKSGHPLEAVNFKKQQAISKCAMYYLLTHNLSDCACRFDVISVENEQITHIENAFDFVGDYL